MIMNLFTVPVAEASVRTLMNSITKVIIDPLIVFMFALAMVYFVYGIVQYLLSPGSEEVKKTTRSHMIWAVVGMFIMLSVYGIIHLIINTIS